MLSATPVHTGAENLFTLLQLLRADLFPNFDTFGGWSSPTGHVTDAMRHVRTGATRGLVARRPATRSSPQAGPSWGAEALVRAPQFVRELAQRLRSGALWSDEERVDMSSRP